jgi:hypothetical protein
VTLHEVALILTAASAGATLTVGIVTDSMRHRVLGAFWFAAALLIALTG